MTVIHDYVQQPDVSAADRGCDTLFALRVISTSYILGRINLHCILFDQIFTHNSIGQ